MRSIVAYSWAAVEGAMKVRGKILRAMAQCSCSFGIDVSDKFCYRLRDPGFFVVLGRRREADFCGCTPNIVFKNRAFPGEAAATGLIVSCLGFVFDGLMDFLNFSHFAGLSAIASANSMACSFRCFSA